MVQTGSISIFLGLPLAAIACSGMVLSLVNYSLMRTDRSSKLIRIISLILFALFVAHYFNTALYLLLWNYLIAAHIALIGIGLYALLPAKGVLRIPAILLLVVSVCGLLLAFLIKLQAPLFYSTFFYLLITTSLVILIQLVIRKV